MRVRNARWCMRSRLKIDRGSGISRNLRCQGCPNSLVDASKIADCSSCLQHTYQHALPFLAPPIHPTNLALLLLDNHNPSQSFLLLSPCVEQQSTPVITPTTQYTSNLQFTMNASSFLQLQTQAAHQPRRPATKPLQQNVLATYGSDTSRRSSSDSDSAPSPATNHARCSRCHRGVSIDGSFPAMMGAVTIGINSYYCQRCADVVGFKP